MPNHKYKQYLGDAVYADFDGYHIILTTENGIETTNRICLEPDVFQELLDYQVFLVMKLKNDSPRPQES